MFFWVRLIKVSRILNLFCFSEMFLLLLLGGIIIFIMCVWVFVFSLVVVNVFVMLLDVMWFLLLFLWDMVLNILM